MENIAKSTSYGCYLDCDFETAKYPDDKTHIVGLLAEYVYDLEQRILHYDERYIKLWNEIETLRECVSKEFDQEQKIADLETKLAECESKRKSLEEKIKFLTEETEENFVDGQKYNQLKQQLAEKEKEKEKEKSLSIKSVVRTLMKDNNLNCTFRDKTNAQIQQCGDVYNSNYGYFNFEDDYDESLNNKNDNRFDITSIDLTNQDKISFAVEQLEQIINLFEPYENEEKDTILCANNGISFLEYIDNQIEELKKEMK